MKIVDVAEFYAERGGGVRTYINQKLAAGAAAGHEIVIVAPGPEDGEEERLGGRIVWVRGPKLPPDPRYYVLWREGAVHRVLDRERPDVVEGSSPWTGGWFAARWRGDAVKSFIFHQDPVAVYPQTFLGGRLGEARVDRMFGWYWGYLRRLSGHFDATVVSSHWLAERVGGFGLANPEAVPFGIAKDAFSPARRDPRVRAELLAACGLEPSATLLVNVSRHHPEKRLGTLLDALALAREGRAAADHGAAREGRAAADHGAAREGRAAADHGAAREGRAAAGPGIGLVQFGDGPLRKWVERRAAAVGGVHLAGFVPDRDTVAVALASADAMIHGSAAETYGLVVAEGLCSGLPIVVPSAGGAADLADPAWAETYTAGDAKGCARAIVRLLGRDRAALAAGCARAADTKIGTMADHFRALFALYERLVAAKRRGRGRP